MSENEDSLENEILSRLHQIIDKKFNRIDRNKKVNPVLLENGMTLFSLIDEFPDKTPEEMAVFLKTLVARKSVVTNMGNEDIFPFDAYFIPSTEIIDKEYFKIYCYVKSILHK